MRRRMTAIATAAVLIGSTGTLPATAADPVKVLGTKADEYNPAASDTYLSWNLWNGSANVVYAKPFGGARMRVSPTGASGWNGSIDGTSLTYQQYSQKKGTSDIYQFDLVTKNRTKLPGAINTKRWEYGPSASGDIIAFARWFPTGDRKLFVYDMGDGKSRTVATTSGSRVFLEVGQVSGNWLTYERYAYNKRDQLTSCEVFLYDIAGRTTSKIPNPNSRCQYGPSVDPAGTVYFARGAFTCGKNQLIQAYPMSGPASTLTQLADGRQVFSTYAVDNADNTSDVYYDPSRCKPDGSYGPGDIWKVTTPP